MEIAGQWSLLFSVFILLQSGFGIFLYFYVILHSNVFCTQLSGCPYLTKVSKRSLLSKAQLLRPDYEAAASGLKLREAELGGRCRRVLARRRRAVVLRLV